MRPDPDEFGDVRVNHHHASARPPAAGPVLVAKWGRFHEYGEFGNRSDIQTHTDRVRGWPGRYRITNRRRSAIESYVLCTCSVFKNIRPRDVYWATRPQFRSDLLTHYFIFPKLSPDVCAPAHRRRIQPNLL